MGFQNNNAFPASITPMPSKVTVQDNYIDFQAAGFSQWAQQYLPELYEAEVERYGNRNHRWILKNGRRRDANDIRPSYLD